MQLNIVILAAGKGTRMVSELPKVLQPLGHKPMLAHVVDAAQALGAENIHIVLGYGAGQVQSYFAKNPVSTPINWVMQERQLGTGHAVQQAMPGIKEAEDDAQVLILFGDVPLLNIDTLKQLLQGADSNSLSLLTLITENPTGLGRIIRDGNESVSAIVEEKDASESQKAIKEVNSGIMAAPASKLKQWLDAVGNQNAQGEYYLTDIVALAAKEGCSINATTVSNEFEVQGVNDKAQLAMLERHYQMKNSEELLNAGVTLRDPARVDVRGVLNCGSDVEIDINAIFEGEVRLGNGVKVGPNVVIKNAVVGDNVIILAGTNIDGATIGKGSSVGPYARIRPGTVLKEDTKIGNFVETKNAVIGKGSKASHLAYIGDAELGENVNIGAGTIVCNYDGVNKHKTVIGNNVFVGSNSVLVAPVTLADNAFIAAGSAINSDVPGGHLAVGRAKQRNIPGWKRPTKK